MIHDSPPQCDCGKPATRLVKLEERHVSYVEQVRLIYGIPDLNGYESDIDELVIGREPVDCADLDNGEVLSERYYCDECWEKKEPHA